MGLNYFNLDSTTRGLMVEEIRKAVDDHSLYISPRLTESAQRRWPEMLLDAAMFGNDNTLSSQLSKDDCIIHLEARRNRGDFSQTVVAVPVTAADTLAEGEFNRYYIKAVCRRAVQEGVQIVVYRGKDVLNPSPESQQKVGKVFEPTELNLSRPGSGLTVMLTK